VQVGGGVPIGQVSAPPPVFIDNTGNLNKSNIIISSLNNTKSSNNQSQNNTVSSFF
jgi:hypothetical protein